MSDHLDPFLEFCYCQVQKFGHLLVPKSCSPKIFWIFSLVPWTCLVAGSVLLVDHQSESDIQYGWISWCFAWVISLVADVIGTGLRDENVDFNHFFLRDVTRLLVVALSSFVIHWWGTSQSSASVFVLLTPTILFTIRMSLKLKLGSISLYIYSMIIILPFTNLVWGDVTAWLVGLCLWVWQQCIEFITPCTRYWTHYISHAPILPFISLLMVFVLTGLNQPLTQSSIACLLVWIQYGLTPLHKSMNAKVTYGLISVSFLLFIVQFTLAIAWNSIRIPVMCWIQMGIVWLSILYNIYIIARNESNGTSAITEVNITRIEPRRPPPSAPGTPKSHVSTFSKLSLRSVRSEQSGALTMIDIHAHPSANDLRIQALQTTAEHKTDGTMIVITPPSTSADSLPMTWNANPLAIPPMSPSFSPGDEQIT